MAYVNSIETLFKNNNYKVKKRIDNNPDDDFIIMSISKYFVQSCGGFSKLIGQNVTKRGNHVYN